MKVLLDTHVFIWADSQPSKLSPNAFATLQNPANQILLSVASLWEIQIKLQAGKLTLSQPLADIMKAHVAKSVRIVPVLADHAFGLESLPPCHRDPFDRLLVAQANVEGASLLTADPVFAHYPVTVIW